jgi:hypothetical protein
MMGKTDGTENHEHQGRTWTLEGNKEISHRPWYRRIRISRIGTQEGVAEEMSEDQKYEKRIKESNVRLVKVLRETVSLNSSLQAAAAKERETKNK